jgi:hypothetical protein
MPIGVIKKMQTEFVEGGPVEYTLPVGSELVSLNLKIGKGIGLRFTGKIFCVHCGTQIKKSFSQGYCYKCFVTLPETDMCIVSPEKCHFAAGTCRNSDWGRAHCFIEHTIYLANSSGPKVGITRSYQRLHRWMDQGAIQALPLAVVPNRLMAGKVEVILKKFISDRTDWRKMLKGDVNEIDLEAEAAELVDHLPDIMEIDILDEVEVKIQYPVASYPRAVKSFNLDREPIISGTLQGIKGQYLIFDNGVINMRKYGGYEVDVEV